MKSRFIVVFLVLGLVAAACDSESEDVEAGDAPACEGEFPAEVKTAEGRVVVEECPTRIVSLSPTATEMLYAIGAGDQVVAVDDQSDFPEGVPSTDLSGFEPNVEAVAGYEPDLVVASNDPGELVSGLERLDIPTLMAPAAVELSDTYEQLRQLGTLTGHAEEAEEVAEDVEADLDELAGRAPDLDEPLTYYHELDDTYFTATSETFIGKVYALAGLENIADAADREGSGYPQLSAEYIIDADPDFIFLADAECCGITAKKVAKRPGWDQITAVRENGVVPVNEDVASRWGPRVVDFLDAVIEAVEAAA